MSVRGAARTAISLGVTVVVAFALAPDAAGVSRPSAPRSVHAKPGNTTVRITWLPPLSDGGASVNSYSVQRSASATGPWSTVATVTGSTFAWKNTGLTNGVTYYFRTRAHNSAGWSAGSTVVSAVPRTVPSAPQSPSATSGNASATVSWTAPATDGGVPIDEYQVQYSFDEFAWTKLPPVTDTQMVVPGLQNGADYFFRVRAHNAAGWGRASSDVLVEPGQPLPPTNVTAQSTAEGVHLSWTPSATTSPPVTSQTIAVSADQIHWTYYAGIAPSTTQWNYAGTLGVTYYFLVGASTASAAGDYAPMVSAADGLAPGAVGNLKVAYYGSPLYSNIVTWTAPGTGSRVQGYTVERKVSGGLYQYVATVTTLAYRHQDPSHGTGYSYRITPFNELGSGPSSEVHIDTP